MPIKTRLIIDNACYHIITRGNQRQKVFLGRSDYEEYLKRIKKYKRKYDFRLYGYCLMPNHVHLIGEIAKKEELSRFMQGITRSYTAYFNGVIGDVALRDTPLSSITFYISMLHQVMLRKGVAD